MLSPLQKLEHGEFEHAVQYHLSKSIVLVGLMGAGKTAIGTILAEKLGCPFLDSDEEIVAASKMSIKEIFERDGEDFFRQKEAQVIARLMAGTPSILSTGGGAFMSADIRAAISAQNVSVWLKGDLDLLWERVKAKDTRPLLMNDDPFGTLKALYDTRSPIYALADIQVEAEPDLSKEAMADKVIAHLLNDPKSGLKKET